MVRARAGIGMGMMAVLVVIGCSNGSERSARSGTSTSGEREAAAEEGPIVVDTFEVLHEWEGDTLLLSLRTDLPETTALMVTVGRRYWREGSSDAYGHSYRSEKTTVGAWEGGPHRVPIDDEVWQDSLRAHQRLMARFQEPYEVRRILDSVHVGFTVPVNQDDPRFGSRNENLVGEAVRTEGLRVVTDRFRVAKPFGGEPATSPWVSWTALRPGHTYVLGDRVPVSPMCEMDSAEETMDAIEQVYVVEKGAVITVREINEGGCPDGRGSHPWYRARITGPDGARLGTGWINSAALIGQDIRERSP